MKNFIKKIVLFTIVLAAMISSMSSFCFAANGKLYCNGSTSWPINNPEEILKFSLSPSGDLVEGGSFSYPSFMTMTPEKGNCWHADFSNAKPGDEGTITYTENGQSYSCKIWLNLSDPNPNSEYGNWDGVNFTPSASQIKERRPLYSRGTIYSEDL